MRVMKLSPFRTPARNDALLYMAYGNVSVHSARPLPGSLTCHRSRQLALLRSVQGAHPLRRSAAIPLTSLHRFLPAGHAKHGATSQDVFDWTQSGQSGGLGVPQQAAWGYRKRYPHALLAYIIGIPDSIQLIRSPRLPSECFTADQELGVIIGTKGSTRILVISSHCVFHQISVIEGVSDV